MFGGHTLFEFNIWKFVETCFRFHCNCWVQCSMYVNWVKYVLYPYKLFSSLMLSVTERHILKLSKTSVDLPFSCFGSMNFYFINFEALLLYPCRFDSATSWKINHFIVVNYPSSNSSYLNDCLACY